MFLLAAENSGEGIPDNAKPYLIGFVIIIVIIFLASGGGKRPPKK